MKYLFAAALVLFCVNVFAQDTVYYDYSGTKVTDGSIASEYEIIELKGNGEALVKHYSISGKIKSEYNYLPYSDSVKTLHGPARQWNDNGQKIMEGNFKEGKRDGQLLTYWDNGQLKRNDMYKDGELVEGKCYTKEGKKTAYFDYEVMPSFKGGDKALINFLVRNVKYPPIARENGMQGKVYVTFIIDKEGYVTEVRILRGVSPELDAEAIRVVNLLPKWKPGYMDGIPVKVQYNLPINFTLRN